MKDWMPRGHSIYRIAGLGRKQGHGLRPLLGYSGEGVRAAHLIYKG